MPTIQINRGALAGLPTGSAGEPLFTTDQFRLYVGSAGGNRLLGLLDKIDGTTAPTVNDDAGDGFSVGSVWTDTTNDKSYILSDSTIGAAVWQQFSGAGVGTGTVTSVNASGGTTGLTFSGGPVTASGTLTLSGTLAVANGGTGLTSFAANTFPARASTGSFVAQTITDFGLSLVDDTNATAARTTLGLGTLATQSGTFSGTSSGTNTGDQTITLTGDVTGSGTGSFAATIANSAVTNAKLANMTQALVKGRDLTAGTGAPTDLTGTQVTSLLDVFTAGAGAKKGLVLPGSTGTSNQVRFLRDNATWHEVPGEIIAESVVLTSETTTAVTPTPGALATAQQFTFTLDAAAVIVVEVAANCAHSVTGASIQLWVEVDGAQTQVSGAQIGTAGFYQANGQYYAGSLAAGSHTIKLLFSGSTAGTSTFRYRRLTIKRTA